MSGPNRTYSFGEGDDGSAHPSSRTHAMHSQYDDVSQVSDGARMNPTNGLGMDHGLASVPEDGHRGWGRGPEPSPSILTGSSATPGLDNLGPGAVGGGISGIALSVANSHDRLSGVEALMGTEGQEANIPAERGFGTTGSDNPYIPAPPEHRYSYGSNVALGAAAAPAGQLTPGQSVSHLSSSNPSQRNLYDIPYQGVGSLNAGPYQRHSAYSSNDLPVDINPDEIVDDGDDGFAPAPNSRSGARIQTVPAAAGGAAAGGVLGNLGGLFGGKSAADTSYGPVPGAGLEAGEKGRWVKPKPGGGSRKRGWIVGAILAFIIIGAIVGGAVGGTIGHKDNAKSSSASSSSTQTANGDTSANGDLDKNSAEIKALMNNNNLHKVFPGIDYTPWGVQYPLCLKYPPSQNNVTRDMAVLTQLTNNVRLYGTDCNQTEMVLHAIDKLELKDMKIWLGVWIDSNETTSRRQLDQLYKIIDDAKDTSIFNGAIVGNEALFRAGSDKASAQRTLTNYMQEVKDYFKKKNLDLPVATSDLGDNWDATLVQAADVVMSNVHPFFGGIPIDQAAAWTWQFWQDHDVALTKGTNKKQVISEVGWPSGGGNDCGSGANCPNDTAGSVAGIDEMNKFMEDWVCQALENGTDYFWFEAFDEPWKIQYNTANENWEDKWGLMDAARNLKPGLKIPDCGGKTATR
ncbi:probable glucan endo-1,3-beta-glucosidase btgC [Aspergillus udagawae]|nr:probable glucan endo-1,3-beta-glucosidase btgC [Aspergillus udagawae]GFG17294.1 probable glucan endo-1,3-beta-glucosidase btgC [Aspergillus udagawae]